MHRLRRLHGGFAVIAEELSPERAARRSILSDARRLATKVGWEYFPVAFVGRLPFAMMVVRVLTLVATLRGSVAEGGPGSGGRWSGDRDRGTRERSARGSHRTAQGAARRIPSSASWRRPVCSR